MNRRVRTVIGITGVSLLVGLAPGASAHRSGPIRFRSGPGSVPSDAESLAVNQASGRLCVTGSLKTVVAEGSTTLGDLELIQPDTPGLDMLAKDWPSGKPLFAAVVSGSCQYGDPGPLETATRGYVLFDVQGTATFARVWRSDLAPTLTVPFGPSVDRALLI